MKQFLIDTFRYNEETNIKLLSNIGQLSNPIEAIKYFSHLINSQNKWMARILQNPKASSMDWWNPVYDFEDLENEWKNSIQIWIEYLTNLPETELTREVNFIGFDGGTWVATPQDIVIQLNFHSVHHRAQIQTILREQGIEPSFVDYIGTKYRKIS